MKSVKLSLSAIVVLFSSVLMAGGINVATGFYKSYIDNETVAIAENGNLDGRIGSVLAADDLTIDEKAAIVDALASSDNWNVNNVETFKMFLGRTNKMSFENLDYEKLSGTDLFVLGYLMLVDNNTGNDEALNLLEMAKAKLPQSRTVNLIYLLAEVNALAEKSDWCASKKLIDSVKADNSFANDMKPEAVEIILGSLDEVAVRCK
jgi:hypothetical protein